MKRTIIAICTFICLIGQFQANAQSNYKFTTEINLDETEVKSQDKTGTCWSFSTTSFVESELIRMGKGTHNISEMYNVRMVYPEKAESYVRFHGNTVFGEGSLSHDVINSIKSYGMVPESIFSGLRNNQTFHDHTELSAVLKAMVDVYVKNPAGKLSDFYLDAIHAVLDQYLGEIPEQFEYKGKTYSPQSFSKEMGFNADDYIEITSFTHHPFYETFVLEVPDNFSKESYYNVPLNELMTVIDNALKNGFTIAWDADVSEEGFNANEGMAIVPYAAVDELTEKEQENLFTTIIEEKEITQENRQEAFNNYETTDDHLMHITGTVKDQNGNIYYVVKNSWGLRGFDGYLYVSEAYIKYKSIAIMIHKDAVPENIKKKINLK